MFISIWVWDSQSTNLATNSVSMELTFSGGFAQEVEMLHMNQFINIYG
jgi:hypothetical protein